MTKRTNKFQIGYFEEGDQTNPKIEMQRFETLDAQLHAVFDILGNGIIDGWNLVAESGLSVVVTPGSGHVVFVATESVSNVTITNLTPNTRNYIYAILTQNSYWNKEVDFASFLSQDADIENVYLGYVDTDDTSITGVNSDGRRTLGYLSLIQDLVTAHRHVGGTENPPPVNLASEVQGTLSQDNLPDLDASIITTGFLDEDRFPTLDHITKLINQGTLTHAQLDAYTETLSISDNPLMGETSTVNLLQLILALKHILPNVDDYLVNTIAYIPGISPASYVDSVNTTANVNTVGMVIEGANAVGTTLFTNIWSTGAHFNQGTISNTLVDGDTICLDTEEQTLTLDNFNNISNWAILTTDLSSVPSTLTLDSSTYTNSPTSGKVTIGDQEVEMELEFRKTFDAQDWSLYKFIVFFIKTTSVQHGDVYFYFNDANAGSQNSHTKVLDRNSPTVNVDTLQNGWQEVTIDVTSFTRSSVNTIGMYVSTQEGWDTSKGFEFNIDQIYLTTGNQYKINGYVRLIFGSAISYDFWRVRWDSSVPTDSSSTGLEFKLRYRVSNDNMSYSDWSTYSSVTPFILNPDALYKYIEIEVFFGASTDLTRTACLKKLYLDFYASDTESSFTLNTTDDWVGGTLFNINTTSTANAIAIGYTDEVGQFQYATDGKVLQLSNTFSELYTLFGTSTPKSTYQALNGLSPSFGLITGVSRGSNGNLWVADVDNDRIVEVDKSGKLVKGFFGSFLSEPFDPYGTEDNGPGSNVDVTASTTATSSVTELDVLHSFYNPNDGILTIAFNANLENIYDANAQFNVDGLFVKIGSQRVNVHDSIITLFGVDEDKYNDWFATSSTDSTDNTKFLSQFTFTSHVMQLELQGADKTYMNFMVNQEQPSIVAYTPYQQERMTSSSVTVKFLLYNYTLGTGAGTNSIQVQLDAEAAIEIYTTEYEFTGLSDGLHTVQFDLKEDGATLLTNIEAFGEVAFVVDTATSFSSPKVGIKTPKQNQIYSAAPATVEFEVENFPILPTGQHIQYQLDSESPVDYYSSDSFTLDANVGSHTITLVLVDESGVSFGYTYGSTITGFNIGLNSGAVVNLHVNQNSVYTSDGITNLSSINHVDIGNAYMANIYSPIDVQIVPDEVSSLTNGLSTVVVAKMRSPSTVLGLSSGDRVTEFITRLANEAGGNVSSIASLASIPTAELIYGTKYLDGHSAVQFDMDGNVLMSNNAAKFAKTKTQAKDLLGSAEKIGDSEILLADALNKRAIITYTNLSSQVSEIAWQYDSDRYISDFHIVSNDFENISVGDAAVSPSSTYIKQGVTAVWTNNSTSSVTIYSGTTTPSQFALDPDLTLYGGTFQSPLLQIGDRYSFKFNSTGEYDWFAYDGSAILTGQINVTKNRLSSNDKFVILENDGLASPYSSRVIKVNSWGNILWSFGEGYLVKPRDARPLLDGGVVIST